MGNSATKPSYMNAEQLVTEAIRSNPVVIFSKSYCPYCFSAKSDISNAAKAVDGFTAPVVYELDAMGKDGAEIQNHLARTTGRSTVPNVFIGGVSVGGGDEVSGLAQSGILKQMLAQAPTRLATLSATKEADTVENFVKEQIDTCPVVVFSKSYCPFCIRANRMLTEQSATIDSPNAKVVIHELDEMGARGRKIQDYLMTLTGQRTVPNIFINRQNIGGCDDLMQLQAEGKLEGMLRRAFLPDSEQEAKLMTQNDESSCARNVKEIVLGAGCFWGVELAFQRVVGVVSTEVGYSNGQYSPVTYEAVCSGHTGATEVVRVKYDESVVSLEQLLDVWKSRHDFTSLNKQGNDYGTQYRSAVYFNEASQKEQVDKWMERAREHLVGDQQIVTEIVQVNNYCSAEEYHQRYLEKKGQSALKGSDDHIRCYG